MLCIGQAQSGKTSILYTLKLGSNLESAKSKGAEQADINVIPENVQMKPAPTIGFNRAQIQVTTKLGIQMFDVSLTNTENPHKLWDLYMKHSHIVIFVVDSSDR